MARPTVEAIPHITLGVTSVKQSLDGLLADLEEPVAITMQGRRVAVLVPYAQWVALVEATAKEEPEEGNARTPG